MCDDANAKQEWIQSSSIDYTKLLKRRKMEGSKYCILKIIIIMDNIFKNANSLDN